MTLDSSLALAFDDSPFRHDAPDGGDRLPAGLAEDGPVYAPPRRGRAVSAARRRADTAAYVADLCDELATLARSADRTFLAYLLEMAREEALADAPAEG